MFSLLRTLLRKAMNPAHRVAVLENKKPDVFQTFDPYSICFLPLASYGEGPEVTITLLKKCVLRTCS